MRKVAEGEKVCLEEHRFATTTSEGTLIIEYITEGPLGQDRARCIGLSPIGAQALLDLLANGEAVEHSVQRTDGTDMSIIGAEEWGDDSSEDDEL